MDFTIYTFTIKDMNDLEEMYPGMTDYLGEREREVVTMLGNGISQDVVAQHFGVTRERVRQITARAIRRMRMYIARHKIGKYKVEVDLLKEEIEELEKKKDQLLEECYYEYIARKKAQGDSILAKPVSYLDFSYRTHNVLNAHGVQFVGDLITKTERDLLQFRNMGRKSLFEIKDKLEQYGLSLAE